MKTTKYLQFVLAVPVLLTCTGTANAVVSPLTATASPVSLTYQKPSTSSTQAVKVSVAASTLFFTVDPATVPIWLSLDALNGTAAILASAPTINFSSSAVCAVLSAGTYTANVHLQVATGAADLVVPVTVVIKNVSAVLSVKEGITQTSSWSLGSAIPTVTLTPQSNSDPIAFTAVPAITLPIAPLGWMLINHASGIGYSIGSTPITVSFLPQVFALAKSGDALTGTVTLTPSVGSAVVVSFTINVTPPVAAISSLYPAATPVLASGALTVVVTGTGFIAAPPLEKTICTVGSVAQACTVVSSTTITLSVDGATYLAAAAPVAITAQNPNPNGSAATAATSNLSVTDAPIIYSIVNSGSYLQPAVPVLVPYESISIFGDNFGASPTVPLLAALDAKGAYPTKLDPVVAQDLVVTFYKQDGTTVIANAPILFATQNQINCLVPSGINAALITGLKVSVTYNSVESAKITAQNGTADPGIFTTASSGVGQGAILNQDGSVNSATNKATKATTTVAIYLTGLGAPNSTALATALTALAYPASCLSPAAYLGIVNTLTPSPAWTTIDGAVLLSSNIPAFHFAPCFLTTGALITPVTVKIGGVVATVTYAGFVADSIAGLYQVNATVPATAASGVAIPVQVFVGAAASQSGVTMAIL